MSCCMMTCSLAFKDCATHHLPLHRAVHHRTPHMPWMLHSDQPSSGHAGRAMEDGQGVLPDGTQYERQSGEEFGENGHWYRWTRLRGVSQGGKVHYASVYV